jgi:hypothetical protein
MLFKRGFEYLQDLRYPKVVRQIVSHRALEVRDHHVEEVQV